VTRAFAGVLILLLVFPFTLIAQELGVDHFWIHVEAGAPEAAALVEAGLRLEDSGSTIAPTGSGSTEIPATVFRHEGQGTASIGIRFQNMYLELIWVQDRDMLENGAPEVAMALNGRPETSPFGFGLKLLDPAVTRLPFPSKSYWAPWMRPLASLAVATRSDDQSGDPAIFVIPDYMRWDLRTQRDPSILASADHAVELGKVTGLRVHGPGLPSASPAVRYLEQQGLAEFVQGQEHLLEVEFDGGGPSSIDVRPALPMLIRY